MGPETKAAVHVTAAGLILQPRRLTQVLGATWAALLAGTVTTASRGGRDIVFARLVTMALLLALWLVRKGRRERAGALMPATLTKSVSVLIYLGQGIHAEAVCAFRGILVFASMFGSRLIDLGCHYGQGFYWSPALPPDEFFAFASRYRLA